MEKREQPLVLPRTVIGAKTVRSWTLTKPSNKLQKEVFVLSNKHTI